MESNGPNNISAGGSPPGSAAEPIRFGSNVAVGVIGEGGMATVYKVWNEPLEVFRVVKLLSRDASSERFETEAKIIAKLHHENIVEVYSFGKWSGRPYMEMEFVDGSDLHNILAGRGKLPEEVAAAIALFTAEALEHAHSLTFTLAGKTYCGVIHRDIKPANILIAKNGAVKLSDFGIARPIEASLHTQGNEKIFGTMQYLSPEQMNRAEIDSRSDIYSFGLILYEMLSGTRVFPQTVIPELIRYKSANSFKRLAEHGVSVSAGIENIMLRCLNYEPANRYQNARALIDDLQKVYDSLTTQRPKDLLKSYFADIVNTVDTYSAAHTLSSTTAIFSLSEIQEKPDAPETSQTLQTPQTSQTFQTSKTPEPLREPITSEFSPSAKSKKPLLFAASAVIVLVAAVSLIYFLTRPGDTVAKSEPEPEIEAAAASFGIADHGSDDAEYDAEEYDTEEPDMAYAADDAPTTVEEAEARNIVTPQPTASRAFRAEPATQTPEPSPYTYSSSSSFDGAWAASRTWEPEPVADAQQDRRIEAAQLRDAVNAAASRQWDRAIAILEQESLFKTRNGERTLHLFNAYVESRRFDRARAILDTTSLLQDAYFLFCVGKFWLYQNSPDRAVRPFEMSLTRSSIVGTKNILPEASLYYLADIMHDRYKANPSAANKATALEAWRKVAASLTSRPNDPRAQRANMEITALGN